MAISNNDEIVAGNGSQNTVLNAAGADQIFVFNEGDSGTFRIENFDSNDTLVLNGFDDRIQFEIVDRGDAQNLVIGDLRIELPDTDIDSLTGENLIVDDAVG